MNAPPDLHFPIDTLYAMLAYQRPAFSKGEQEFIERFIDTLPGCSSDRFGNRWVVTNAASRTLFSAHTDTVHPKHNPDYRQKLLIDQAGILSAEGKQQLGADNGVGCWILMNLIMANVPGTYIFHRAEEIGGKGSTFIADKAGEHLGATYDRAIAFDRKGTTSIITYQSCERGCSDAFALALAEGLNLGHEMDDGGTFTDTRNYFDHIPECTNISAGYMNEHTFNETLDTAYALRLVRACLALDWASLPTARDPRVTDYLYGGSFGGAYSSYASWTKHDRDYDDYEHKRFNELLDDESIPDMYTMVYEYPDAVAQFLLDYGYEEKHVWEAIADDVRLERARKGNH